VNHVDFDQNFDPINPSTDSGGGRYTAQDGDTLQTVAAAVWGDAAMWYLLADANGMTGDTQLAAGMSLIIPAKVANVHNNADTFKPYDPNKAIGDVSPTEMKPPERPKQGGCGIIGQIMTVAIAVAVTVLTGSAVLGNLASQAFAIGIGQQSGFSWKSLGMAVITAGVTGGINASGVFAGIADATARAAVTAVASSAASQGIGVATGLQNKFDWVGVAAAGVGAAAGAQVRMPGTAGRILSTFADGAASAGTRSLLTGTSFGDNLIAVLPDVIGRTAGNLAADMIMGRIDLERQEAQQAESAGEGAAGGSGGGSGGASGGFCPPDSELGGMDQIEALATATGATDSQIALMKGIEASAESAGAASGAAQAGEDGGASGGEQQLNADSYINLSKSIGANLGGGGTGQAQLYVGGSSAAGLNGQYGVADASMDPHGFYGPAMEFGHFDDIAGIAQFVQGFHDNHAPTLAGTVDWAVTGVQGALDYVADAVSSGINAFEAQYGQARDRADGYVPDSGAGYYAGQGALGAGDFSLGAVTTVARVIPGSLSFMSHPMQGFGGIARSLDSGFLDNRPASQVVQTNYQALRNSTPRQIATGAGAFGANLVMFGGPAKFAAGRVNHVSRPSYFGNMAPVQAPGRVFITKDPGVAGIINALESHSPGIVRQAEIDIFKPNGDIYTDFDIVTDTHVIQVKTGRGTGIVPQIQLSQTLTDLPVIGFNANGVVGRPRSFSVHVMRNAQNHGIVVVDSVPDLLAAMGK
jgi:hypothetical protein